MFMRKTKDSEKLSPEIINLINDFKEVISTLSAKLEIVSNKVDELENRVAALESSISSRSDISEEITNRLNVLSKEIDEISKNMEKIQDINFWKNRIEEQLNIINSKLLSEYARKDDLVEINKRLDQISKLEQEIDAVKLAVKRLTELLERTIQELENLKREVKKSSEKNPRDLFF
jgi:chromosome segregation ATPase